MTARIPAIALIAILTLSMRAGAQLELGLELVADNLSAPTFVTAPPNDDRLFVVERAGVVRIMENGALLSTPFLDISAQVNVGGEGGLLSSAFHPNYAANGFFYVSYTTDVPGKEGDSVVSRFQVSANPDVADDTTEDILIEVDQPFSNHNGGMLAFRPGDPNNYLYFSIGDGGGSGDPNANAQNINTKLGNILRMDVSTIPATAPLDNPFVGVAGDDFIWAYGLRNPWRFSFDRDTGDMYIGDVGQNLWEEIDFEPASSSGGNNYGWDLLEGANDFDCVDCDGARNSTVLPIHQYPHGAGRSVNGGYVYRGSAIPALQGTYFFSDFNGLVWSFRYDGNILTDFQEHTEAFGTAGDSLVSFGEDSEGELYIVDIGGSVYRIVSTGTPDVTSITGTRLLEEGGTLNLNANVSNVVGSTIYTWLQNGNPLANGGRVSGADTPNLVITPAQIGDSGSYALQVEDEAKAITISEPVLVTVVAAGSLPAMGPLLWTLLLAMVLISGLARYIGRTNKR